MQEVTSEACVLQMQVQARLDTRARGTVGTNTTPCRQPSQIHEDLCWRVRCDSESDIYGDPVPFCHLQYKSISLSTGVCLDTAWSRQTMPSNKDRLYVALYVRGGKVKMPGLEDKLRLNHTRFLFIQRKF